MLMTILYIFGGIILLILLIGFTSPRISKMNRSVVIEASEAEIFPYLNNLKTFVDKWSPWTEKDPNATHNYNDVAEGADPDSPSHVRRMRDEAGYLTALIGKAHLYKDKADHKEERWL